MKIFSVVEYIITTLFALLAFVYGMDNVVNYANQYEQMTGLMMLNVAAVLWVGLKIVEKE